MVVKVFIHDQRGGRLEINLCDTEEQLKDITVRDLKRRVAERKGITEDGIWLIFDDRQLEDDKRLSYYGVKHEATIHMFQSIRCEPLCLVQAQYVMGDRDGRNSSMDRLADFRCRLQ